MTTKVQRKQLARDVRLLSRTLEVLRRLNMTAEQPGALALALERIKQRSEPVSSDMYPVTDKALCKQIRRDERTIKAAIELVKRMGIDPEDRLALLQADASVNEHKKQASREDLQEQLKKQHRREMTEKELLK